MPKVECIPLRESVRETKQSVPVGMDFFTAMLEPGEEYKVRVSFDHKNWSEGLCQAGSAGIRFGFIGMDYTVQAA